MRASGKPSADTETAARLGPEAIRLLQAEGLRVVMLTGDSRPSAEAVARALALDAVIAEVQPAEKAEVFGLCGGWGCDGGRRSARVGSSFGAFSLDSIRLLQLPDVAGDAREVIGVHGRYRGHVAEAPMMGRDTAPDGEQEARVCVMSRTIDRIDERRPGDGPTSIRPVASGTVKRKRSCSHARRLR